MPLRERFAIADNVIPFPAKAAVRRAYNEQIMPPEVQPVPRRLDRFRLGPWTVVPSENRLVDADEVRRLEPRTMDVLVCLAERAGEVVSKNALIDQVWEGSFISEGTLTNAVAELRAALDDDARHPRFIETIPKRGYRLMVPLVTEEAEPPSTPEGSRRSRRSSIFFTAALAALAAAIAAGVLLWPRAGDLDSNRVFIVPLANRTGDPSLDPIGALAADRLTAELSASGFAEPVPAGGARKMWNVREVSAEARGHGSGLALVGAYYLHEGGVEVQIQLIDVLHEAVLYAVPPEISPRDRTTEAVDNAAQRALGAVVTHLHSHAHSQLLSRPPIFEAYKEFVAGSMLWGVDYVEGVRHLERAVALDPAFVSAQLRLAMGYQVLGRKNDALAIVAGLKRQRQDLTEFEQLWVDLFDAWFDGRLEDRLRLLRQIEIDVPEDLVVKHLIAVSALALNRPREALAAFGDMAPEDAPEWMQRGRFFAVLYEDRATAYHRVGRHEDELAVARAGLRQIPSHGQLREAEVRALASTGETPALEQALAVAASSPSRDVDPGHLLIVAAASARAHGHESLAEDLAARAVSELESRGEAGDDPELLWIAARGQVYRGDLEVARQILEDLRSRHPSFAPITVARWLGVVAARQGDIDRAADLDAWLQDVPRQESDGLTSYSRAAIAAWLGHRRQALELLRRAQREGWASYSLLHDHDHVLFEPLLGEPEFEAMLHPEG